MLFNSYGFIFLFLPIALLGVYIIGARSSHRFVIAWLVAMSLVFYSWWNPNYLALLIFSILANYSFSLILAHNKNKFLLGLGVGINLFLLGFFKYTNFFLENLSFAIDTDLQVSPIILPLAISFFTFQQIAYLIDIFHGHKRGLSFMRYCLFVSFFPQLIAGPIVHHKEMSPQFIDPQRLRIKENHIAVGLTIFIIGLFKKVAIADNVAPYANPIFDAAATGQSIGFIEGWGAALAYSFQLYFDFSGYSDMAVGLARIFGIRLPINFFSPYKAESIIDFWRRWHMTLSHFLRDYVYIPLGGNRRRNTNIIITMLIGGLWHGAGWNFIAWGGLHGLYLIINHNWRKVTPENMGNGTRWVGRILTFVSVVIGWVLFRAESWNGSTAILSGMFGLNGIQLSQSAQNINWLNAYGIFIALIIIVWTMPNTYQIMSRYWSTLSKNGIPAIPIGRLVDFKWRMTPLAAYITAIVAITSLLMLTRVSEFLYYRF
jgi:D-alanyl-lipoteichoic acid acyltransferase DltB (MBOAT superfamily)